MRRGRLEKSDEEGLGLSSLLTLLAESCGAVPKQNVEIQSKYKTEKNTLFVYFLRWMDAGDRKDVDAVTTESLVSDGNSFGTAERLGRMIQDQNYSEINGGFLPPFIGRDLDMRQYNTVFLGYPVWTADVLQAVHSS